MAFQHIRIKNTNVAGKVPGADKLDVAELCVNLKDQKLYSKDADGNIFELGGTDGEVPGGETGDRPSTPSPGDLFFDTTLNQLLYWNGTEWVPIAGDDGGDDYVKISGDHMKGDLTVGLDDGTALHTLDAGGNAAFGVARDATVNVGFGPNSTGQVVQLGTSSGGAPVIRVDSAGQSGGGATQHIDVSAPVQIYYDVNLSPLNDGNKLTLRAANGSASFAEGKINLNANGEASFAQTKAFISDTGGAQFDNTVTVGASKIKLNSGGLGEFSNGVEVAGGNASSIYAGMSYDKSNDRLNLSFASEPVLTATTANFSIKGQRGRANNNAYGLSVQPDWTESNRVYNVRSLIQTSATFSPESVYNFYAENSAGTVTGSAHYGFYAHSSLGSKGAKNYGFYSALNSNGDKNFNYFASTTAPNFLGGSTYIGGSVARNTFELWKSTLTEEQLEQLEAGTLVAPANVTTPGDGEFARQWWYNQQDAETKALIDSGEREYPAHLAAATFTDTFALTDNTNIHLLSGGGAYFAGHITVADDNKVKSDGAINIESGGGASIKFKTNSANSDYLFYQTGSSFNGKLRFNALTGSRAYTFPDKGGTIALLDDIASGGDVDLSGYVTIATDETITGQKTFDKTIKVATGKGIAGDGSVNIEAAGYINVAAGGTGSLSFRTKASNGDYRFFNVAETYRANLRFEKISAIRNFDFPDKSGTIALTNDVPDVSDFVTLSTDQTITGKKTIDNDLVFKASKSITNESGLLTVKSAGGLTLESGGTDPIRFKTKGNNGDYRFYTSDSSQYADFRIKGLTANRSYVFPDKNGTVALTGDIPDVSDFVTLSTEQTIVGQKTFSEDIHMNNDKGIEGLGRLLIHSSSGDVVMEAGGTSVCEFKSKNNNSAYRFYNKNGTNYGELRFTATTTRNYTFPNKAGTVALTSDIPTDADYVTIGTEQTITGQKTFDKGLTANKGILVGSTDTSICHLGINQTDNRLNLSQVGTTRGLAVSDTGNILIGPVTSYISPRTALNINALSAGGFSRGIYIFGAAGTGGLVTDIVGVDLEMNTKDVSGPICKDYCFFRTSINSADFNNTAGQIAGDVVNYYSTPNNNIACGGRRIAFLGMNDWSSVGAFNFYAEGSAPNYFKGNIDCDGTVSGTFSLRMQSDDPSAFQTTYSTDAEGNQVEEQTYTGTTEDLLTIIKDLRARVAALEAAAA